MKTWMKKLRVDGSKRRVLSCILVLMMKICQQPTMTTLRRARSQSCPMSRSRLTPIQMKALNSLIVCKHRTRIYMELVAILRIVPKVISIRVAHQSATNFLRISLTKVFCRIGHTRAFRRTFLMKSLAKTCLPTGLRIRRSLPFWLRLVRISASTPTKMH